MKQLLNIILLLTLFSCNNRTEKWETAWKKHNVDFREVVDLIKADKLNVVYGRSGYSIPDSIDLKITCGQLAYRETDFTYDSTYSILFRLDTNKQIRTSPIIVYTNNKKRINEYESNNTSAIKIEKNWYYIYR